MVYYIGFFSESNPCNVRYTYLSAENKMKYLLTAFTRQQLAVRIVSCSTSKSNNVLLPSYQLWNDIPMVFFASLGKKNKLRKAVDRLIIPVQLFLYLLWNVKYGDVLVVYHATACMQAIKIVKSLKKCKLVLELEELYSDVNGDKRLKKREYAMADSADAFIFPTQLLNNAVNSSGKPFAIVHGTYQVEEERKCRFNDGKIHVVYAGTLDPRKGGAAAAAAAAEFLPENYHVHVLGFGSEQQINDMKQLTLETSQKGKATVTYDGLLSGEDYIRFIQACDIGLSTQNPDAAFNATSFPSKVLSYMANGLRVVSVRIEAIESSAVGDLITYYEEQTPECIASAIMSVDVAQPYDSRKRIAELDARFQKELHDLVLYN